MLFGWWVIHCYFHHQWPLIELGNDQRCDETTENGRKRWKTNIGSANKINLSIGETIHLKCLTRINKKSISGDDDWRRQLLERLFRFFFSFRCWWNRFHFNSIRTCNPKLSKVGNYHFIIVQFIWKSIGCPSIDLCDRTENRRSICADVFDFSSFFSSFRWNRVITMKWEIACYRMHRLLPMIRWSMKDEANKKLLITIIAMKFIVNGESFELIYRNLSE